MKVSCVINVSRFNESPQRAVESVLGLKEWIAQVIIVGNDVNAETISYKDWKKHLSALQKSDIEVLFQPSFNLNEVQADLMLDIPSTTRIHNDKTLFSSRLSTCTKQFDKYPRFAFESLIDLTQGGGSWSFWYLCLAVLFCVDWWRQTFSWFTFHTNEHIRLTEIWRSSKKCRVAPSYSPWLSCCGFGYTGDRHPIINTTKISTTGPMNNASLNGKRYFFYWMDQRENTSFSGWKGWFLVAIAFYTLSCYPLWPKLISWVAAWLYGLGSRTPPQALDSLITSLSTRQTFSMVVMVFLNAAILSLHIRWAKRGWLNTFCTLLAASLIPFVIHLVFPWIIWWAKIDRAYNADAKLYDPSTEKEDEED